MHGPAPSITAKPTRMRYGILAAVFVSVVINYMDRSNLSVAASFIADELKLDNVQLGYLFSAFGMTYAFCQIPGGILADRFGNRGFYSLCLILWSLATVLQGFAEGFLLLFAMRILVGISEAPSYPLNNRIVTRWFPENERAGAIATYTSGQFLGLAFLTPALMALVEGLGWRALFFVTGGIGLVWGLVWFIFYRDPYQHRMVNQAELALIEQGGGLVERGASKKGEPFKWRNLLIVLTQRKLWGIYLGQFGMGATIMFFLTWFPKYLKDYKGMEPLESRVAAAIPFICAFAGVLLSGHVSDFLVRRGASVNVARKAPIITGLLFSMTIIGANYVSDPVWVTFFMSTAFFGNGLASITWVFVSLLAPRKLIGLTGGTFNFIGGLSAILVPIAIGYLAREGDFAPALVFICLMTLLAIASYVFLVGDIKRIEVEA